MKGSETKLVAYMDGTDKKFVIPVYQRNYDWKKENCVQLFEDLVKINKQHRKSHFFGSIVSVNSDGGFCEFLIIDGQQRLTTVSLLMLAMVKLIEEGKLVPRNKRLAEMMKEAYLVDKWKEDDDYYKLKPIKDDRQAYHKLFRDKEDYDPQSNLTINFEYFYNRIQKEELTLDELYEAIKSLEIINITLDSYDNPQLIFESLNSTGLALSEADKIRNFILMGLPVKTQSKFFEQYWSKIEDCTNHSVDAFVRDYLSIKQLAIPALRDIYKVFKDYVQEKTPETEALLTELLEYARRYEILLNGTKIDAELNACIKRLNRLETTVTRPFFLEVLRLYQERSLTIDQVRTIFSDTESYLFRRSICELPTNTLNKVFLTLHKDILRYDGTSENYVAKFKYALMQKREKARYPRDDEFVQSFSVRPVYQMNSKNKLYILERFENYGILETKAIYEHVDAGDYSVEHIMPQHLTPQWAEALGDDYEEIHKSWLHRMANLTLTAYNSSYSNRTFEEKRTMSKGFLQSGLRMNTWIARQHQWGLAELEQRNDLLMQEALHIWAMPQTNYLPTQRQMESYALSDEEDMSGRDIARFTYRRTDHPVTSWIEMMEQVLVILHSEDRSVLTRIAYTGDNTEGLAAYVSNQPEKLRGAMKIDEGIYVERNTSTSTKMTLLLKFFKAFNVNPDDLVFYLKEDIKAKDEEEAGTRYELRRRYWNYALPIIKNVHQGNGCFQNCNASRENWIASAFGIAGFNLSCVANFDCARMELRLSKGEKSANKEAFDFLYQHKAQIESQLGVELTWQRSDNTKGSYMAYGLGGVSISNEIDWTQMAKFHAEWSKKFYDVIVPILKKKY